jgi:hypothetical protein
MIETKQNILAFIMPGKNTPAYLAANIILAIYEFPSLFCLKCQRQKRFYELLLLK